MSGDQTCKHSVSHNTWSQPSDQAGVLISHFRRVRTISVYDYNKIIISKRLLKSSIIQKNVNKFDNRIDSNRKLCNWILHSFHRWYIRFCNFMYKICSFSISISNCIHLVLFFLWILLKSCKTFFLFSDNQLLLESVGNSCVGA